MDVRLELTVLHWIAVVLATAVSLGASTHALLSKRDSRAAFGWIAVCMLFPAAGPVLYFLFGVNRIRRRALKLEARRSAHPEAIEIGEDGAPGIAHDGAKLEGRFAPLVRTSEALTRRALLAGNEVEPLFNGESAYPAMLDAIRSSTHTIFLSTYIFQPDHIGMRFVDELAAASRRGVDVRVLVDGIGELYGLPSSVRKRLARAGVPVARFLPPRLIPPSIYINLRNHRKILVTDGKVGFTGGINIADKYLVDDVSNPDRASDVHFRLRGPIVTQLGHVFLEDWAFCTDDADVPDSVLDWSMDEKCGPAACRVISDGPHEGQSKLATILTGALALAQRRVTIVTPYFLPEREMIVALQTAALRGVEVSLVLPEKSDVAVVHWGTRNMLWELIDSGVKALYQPAPFAHTKLFLMDDTYAQIGSANLDPRSLRLNFELNVEVYAKELVSELLSYVDRIRERSRVISLEELERRSLPVRIRDACAWLFSPYL